ncbi:hypothetical protein ALC60_00226 [Trachymyrmex zeteki]|uniref:Gustatory receptor n=1 Tax=Mycetomoellerius zeteki TaxID=64791 RepID=A0A151XJU0_9HYME|nr:hypothetical protein ALC60_00226 [Trachymyrmex zeteki]
MKLFTRPKSFSEAIALVTNLSCLLGLRAFEYPRGHPRSLLSLIYFLFVFGIYFSGSFNIEKKYYSNVRLMKLEYFLYKILQYVIIVSVLLKMLLGWWHTKFKVCHKKISEIDETLRHLGLSVNYDSIYFMTIGVITVWTTSSFILNIVGFIHLKLRTDIFAAIYVILVTTYSLTVNAINICEFCLFVREIHAIYGCDTDTDMQEEIQQFGIQILQSPVTFSVFGLTLDMRVLSMILKSVTIYVVIMVQVSMTLESDNAARDVHF